MTLVLSSALPLTSWLKKSLPLPSLFLTLFFFPPCFSFLIFSFFVHTLRSRDKESHTHNIIGIILLIYLGKRTNKQNSSSLFHSFLSTRALEVFKEGFVTRMEKKARTVKKHIPSNLFHFMSKRA